MKSYQRRRGRLALVGGAPLGLALVISLVLAAAGGATPKACGTTVKAVDGGKLSINKYIQDSVHFSPGTVTIKSGCSITFTYSGSNDPDPHTLSIVKTSQLPQTLAQANNCSICNKIGSQLVKNPQQPPGPTNPVLHWSVNSGKPGLDAPGDTVAILEQGVKGHKSITVNVSAPAGTTLHFMCAVHPWMQGTINVT